MKAKGKLSNGTLSVVEGWSEAKCKSFVVSALRNSFNRYPPKNQCIEAAYVDTRINKKTGRMAKHYRCSSCDGIFPRKEIAADHTVAIVGDEGFVDFNTWIDRGFVARKEFTCMCSTCHAKKTKEEAAQRKVFRDKGKMEQHVPPVPIKKTRKKNVKV